MTCLVRGSVQWHRHGLGEKSGLLQAAQQEYLSENDDLGSFIIIKHTVSWAKAKSSLLVQQVLREEYQRVIETVIDSRHFKKAMIAKGIVAKPSRLNGVMCQTFQGIKMRV